LWACRLIEQLTHNKDLSEDEVRRLRGKLAVVEAEYRASERKCVKRVALGC